jgi:hypothetical protein
LVIRFCKPFEAQLDRELQVGFVDDEAFGESATLEQQSLGIGRGLERAREPAPQHAQRLELPRRIGTARQHEHAAAGAHHHLHPAELPRPPDLEHSGVRPEDDVRHRDAVHRSARFRTAASMSSRASVG